LNGDLTQSERLLEQVANDFPGDPRAALSAFQVGVMRLNGGDFHGAERWLNTALSRSPPVSLLEDCYFRLIQAQGLSGARARAQRTAEAYLARFPQGRHRQAVQAELGAANPPEREE
jgi:TolA-binding protein